MKETILVIDDEVKIIEVIKLYLENEGYTVIQATSGIEALEKQSEFNPDLLILDLMLPDISGENVCERIRRESEVPIIMLTAKSSEDSILNGYSIGSDDYITKPFSPKQLVAKVNAVLKRVKGNQRENLIFNNELIIDIVNKKVEYNNKEIILTASEYKILSILAKNPNKIFSREELMDYISRDNTCIYDRIIDTHIKNIRAKLDQDSKNPTYIKTIRGMGYRFNV
ncbi:response regulator transcription factor [Clostridium botulinum]|uniref:Stage 0 sporulation protein A homolog n=1 Tax=Clostridium botulinum (strain Hall / ATCC 3502 / NCTC 13319 / Type A) TaxID=441771 RepID=A5HYF7_CLOBH|nr:response regulator transcription factor [Clostridium botulinum]EPS46384.1 DNA-binding response regulator [Clostridium botulinum CFSAN002367]ABS33612.1 DNA-binding response regulator [Clostridium botulinum A str. ATCC 19397]ABS36598.1 DNA-binding response regulator [Clostridium botulinum A str. Hall]AWB16180.1 DNA-binding response regulator [Clostridium botulinum]AWB28999.1 DNA-binding response regulator [Clostridium botulinum]